MPSTQRVLEAMSVDEAFDAITRKTVNQAVLWDRFFNVQQVHGKARPAAVITEWRKDGMGLLVLQQYCLCESGRAPFCCRGGWKLVLCSSRHLSEAEMGYSVIEGEAVAIAWYFKKARVPPWLPKTHVDDGSLPSSEAFWKQRDTK